MEIVKKMDGYSIVKKRSGRYGVRDKSNNWVKGEKKLEVLMKAGFLKAPSSKKAVSSQEEETSTEG